MSKLSALQFVGIGKESAWGVAADATHYLPINTFKSDEEIKKIVDEGRRGVLAKDFNVLNGPKSSKSDLDSFLYTNEMGLLLLGILGGVSTTGSGAPYSHEFKLANQLPPTFTIHDFNGINQRAYAGNVVEEVAIKFDTENAVQMTAKFQGKASEVEATGTPIYKDVAPLLGLGCEFKLGGVANYNLVGADLTMKREVKLLFGANNTQHPTKFSSGRLEVTGKLTFDVEDDSEYALYLTQQKKSLSFLLNGAADNQAEIILPNVDFSKANVDRSQEWVRVDAEFRAIYDVATGTPISVILTNSTASY